MISQKSAMYYLLIARLERALVYIPTISYCDNSYY